jgi:abequosyltransferase
MTAVTPPVSAPILSLCIPTYKRAALLDGALRAVLEQITPDLAAQVEVIILDNASPDDTPGTVQRAQGDFSHVPLRYVRRPENIGPDANFTDALTQARGEFLYLLSDDDVLLPGAVAALLGLIAAHPGFDAFALNSRPFTHSPDEAAGGIFRLEGDRTLTTRDEALVFLNTHITFLSCIAFRRANVLERDYAEKTGTVLIQAFFFVDALAPGHGFYVTRQPFLAQRADNNQGFNFFEIFVTNFDLVLQYARQNGYSPSAVRQVRARALKFVCYFVGVFKTQGAIGTIRPDYRDGLARLWRVYGPHPVLLLVIVPMILTPRPVYALLWTRAHALYRRAKAWRAGRGEAAP